MISSSLNIAMSPLFLKDSISFLYCCSKNFKKYDENDKRLTKIDKMKVQIY